MKTTTLRSFLAAAVSVYAIAQCRSVDAALLANMNLNQSTAADFSNGLMTVDAIVPVTTTTVPFQTSVSANNLYGASVAASYSITDNGSVAAINITWSGSITAYYNSAGEGSVGSSDTTFSLLQPAMYTATVATTGSAPCTFIVDDNSHQTIGLTTYDTATQTTSGIAPLGSISFFDSVGLPYNNPTEFPMNESGTYSLSLVFTAIPEPSSAALALLPAAALLFRRWRRSQKP